MYFCAFYESSSCATFSSTLVLFHLFHFRHFSEYVANISIMDNIEVQIVSKSLITKDQIMRKGSSH